MIKLKDKISLSFSTSTPHMMRPFRLLASLALRVHFFYFLCVRARSTASGMALSLPLAAPLFLQLLPASASVLQLLVLLSPSSPSGSSTCALPGSSFLVRAILDPSAEEKKQLWGSPNCENAGTENVDWVWFRKEISRIPYPHNIELVIPLFQQFRISHVLDQEAQRCVMGLSTLFYFTCRWTLDSVQDQGRVTDDTDFRGLQQAISQYSVLENYLSAVHPGLLDSSQWPIFDEDIRRLRQNLLDTYRVLAQQDQALQHGFHGRLQVYVYDEDEVAELKKLTIGAMFCGRGQWGMETQIHDFFRAASFRTLDPEAADFFYVPGYAICMLEGNIWRMEEIDQIYIELVAKLPYFQRSRGRDHIFTFGSGMSTSVFESWREHIPEAIVLTPETELFNDLAWIIEPPWQPWKDIVIPGNLDMTELISLQEMAKPLQDREFLGCFFGRADVVRGPHPWVGGPNIRRDILAWANEPDLFISEFTELRKMHAAMGNSKFCFIPRGKSAWSLRLFESLFTNCVPVLLSDKWELPFEDFLDTTKFVIKWPAANTTNLLGFLRSIPDAVVDRYMAAAREIRCWYQYPPKRIDVRHGMRKAHNLCQDETVSAYDGILKTLMLKKRGGVSNGVRRDQYKLLEGQYDGNEVNEGVVRFRSGAASGGGVDSGKGEKDGESDGSTMGGAGAAGVVVGAGSEQAESRDRGFYSVLDEANRVASSAGGAGASRTASRRREDEFRTWRRLSSYGGGDARVGGTETDDTMRSSRAVCRPGFTNVGLCEQFHYESSKVGALISAEESESVADAKGRAEGGTQLYLQGEPPDHSTHRSAASRTVSLPRSTYSPDYGKLLVKLRSRGKQSADEKKAKSARRWPLDDHEFRDHAVIVKKKRAANN